MVRVIIVCTNAEDARGSHSIRAEYVAKRVETHREIEGEVWGEIEVENQDLAEAVVSRYNHEHQVKKSRISLASALDLVILEKAQKEEAATVPAAPCTPYGYDWWYLKGRSDHRTKFDPQFPKVPPYMAGWDAVEDEDRNAHGASDAFKQAVTPAIAPPQVDLLRDEHPERCIVVSGCTDADKYFKCKVSHLDGVYNEFDNTWRFCLDTLPLLLAYFPSPDYTHSEALFNEFKPIECGF
jgi:hypothetical protein